MGLTSCPAEEGVLGGVEDEVVVLQVRDVEKTFEHEVGKLEIEAERFDAGDGSIVDGVGIFCVPFVEEAELFQDFNAGLGFE